MDPTLQRVIRESSFHITTDLAPLIRMIKVMSLRISPKARQRLAWMDAYRESGNASLLCRHFGIPLRTFWYWQSRYDPWDLTTLEDRSRTPKRFPHRTPWSMERAVLAVKREHPRWGVAKLALVLQHRGITISPMTCWRICKRHALIVRYRTRKHRAPKPRVNHAEIHMPGDLFQIDTKHISWCGRRMVQYTAIDVVTKWRHLALHAHGDMQTTIRFLLELRSRAPFPMRMVQTDNGAEFQSRVTAWLQRHRIRHVFSHKHRPQENAYVERSHRTDEEEFWSLGAHGATLPELRANLEQYVTMYNTERPHWGNGGKTPIQKLNSYLLPESCKMS